MVGPPVAPHAVAGREPACLRERFGKRTDRLFDGCSNIAVGTAMVTRYERSVALHCTRRAAGAGGAPCPGSCAALLRGHVGRELGIANFVEGHHPPALEPDLR